MSHTAIRVDGLSKAYRLGTSGASYATLRESIVEALRSAGRWRKADHHILWALRNVCFEVPEGQVLGIIGANGAGKSTLLRVLSQITEPTEGRVEIRGRLTSLLEVGTGFHPELTGRENIFLNGAILGMRRREIRARLEEIVAFAEVARFLDTPVKRYSSGMYLRLAFAVAAHLEPEVLLVDEVLAVGDVAFQRKCLGKMGEVARQGRTVLFVSHNMGAVGALCERAIWLHSGQIRGDGPAASVVQTYLQHASGTAIATTAVRFPQEEALPFQLLSVRLMDSEGRSCPEFDIHAPVVMELEYVIRQSIPGTHVQLQVARGEILFISWDTDGEPDRLEGRVPGRYTARVTLPAPLLKAGVYELHFGMGIARVRGVHNPAEGLRLMIAEHSVDVGCLSYAGDRVGALAMPLNWHTRRLGEM